MLGITLLYIWLQLIKIITDDDNLDNSLFDSNVRGFHKENEVNSSIATTLESSSDIDFWLLNNGATILATEITPITSKSCTVQNPKIVDGLRTSIVIYNYFSKNKEKLKSENRSILVKFIVPKDEDTRKWRRGVNTTCWRLTWCLTARYWRWLTTAMFWHTAMAKRWSSLPPAMAQELWFLERSYLHLVQHRKILRYKATAHPPKRKRSPSPTSWTPAPRSFTFPAVTRQQNQGKQQKGFFRKSPRSARAKLPALWNRKP